MPVEAYFEVIELGSPHRFVIKLVDREKIDLARRIACGRERRRVHLMGTIVRQKAPYNPAWSYHLEPASIAFLDKTAEVFQAAISDVEGHLDEVGGTMLPNAQWCPRGSRLAREVMPPAKRES